MDDYRWNVYIMVSGVMVCVYLYVVWFGGDLVGKVDVLWEIGYFCCFVNCGWFVYGVVLLLYVFVV